MEYIYIIGSFVIAHLLIRFLAIDTVKDYIAQTRWLLYDEKYTDGCTTPFKTYIHRWLNSSRLLCSAHDFGSLGYIKGVNPGIHNNFVTWLAHMYERAPVYWIWGTVVAIVTLPWVVWRRNLGIESVPFIAFHIAIVLAGSIFIAVRYFN